MHCRTLLAAVAAAVATASPVLAETLTDAEILERFVIQRQAYEAVKSGKGATRGLKIITVDELEGDTADADVVANTGEATEATTTEEGTAVVAVESTDVPEGEARVELAKAEVGILPEELQVNVRISFDYDSAVIKADQQPVLDQMCRVIKASDIRLFRIMGHTDAAGSDAYNQSLSLARAEEVKRRLVSDCGIEPARLEPMGLGERFLSDPADPRGPENRRVEFQALS